jgi:hypothetical protein
MLQLPATAAIKNILPAGSLGSKEQTSENTLIKRIYIDIEL